MDKQNRDWEKRLENFQQVWSRVCREQQKACPPAGAELMPEKRKSSRRSSFYGGLRL